MSVTMKDIAILAGVSKQTVAAALSGNGSSRVSAAKKEMIRKLAQELHYIPNAAALALSGQQTKSIGIVASMSQSWNNVLAGEICQLLPTYGYNTLTSHLEWGNLCGEGSVYELISRGVDGLIILNLGSRERIRKLRVPHVLGSHMQNDGYDVGVDNHRTGYVGTRHLIEHGHRQVAYITIQKPDKLRLAGWRQAHLDCGIDISDDYILQFRKIDGQIGALIDFLRRKEIKAIFASNDYVAALLMRSLIDCGMKVPEDIAIVGCDGYSFAEFCPVPLTTVLQPVRKQAEAIVELILKRIQDRELSSEPANINVEPKLWIGGSCGCPVRKLPQLYRISAAATLEKVYKLNYNQDI